MIILHADLPDVQADLPDLPEVQPAPGLRSWKLGADLQELQQLIRNRTSLETESIPGIMNKTLHHTADYFKYNLTNQNQDAVSINFIPTSQHEDHRYDVKDWKGNYSYRVSVDLPQVVEFVSLVTLICYLIYIWFTIGKWMIALVCQTLSSDNNTDVNPPELIAAPEHENDEPIEEDFPPPYTSLNIIQLPPSPSQANGSKPKIMVQKTIDEPPTFHDAIVKMIFKDKKSSGEKMQRSTSAESTMEKVSSKEKNRDGSNPRESSSTSFVNTRHVLTRLQEVYRSVDHY